MNKKIFNPEDHDMVICPGCESHGYIKNPERRCCPKCGGFGFIKREPEEDMSTSPIIGNGKEVTRHEKGRHL